MGQFMGLLYCLADYVLFFVTFFYAIDFVNGPAVKKMIDADPVVPKSDRERMHLKGNAGTAPKKLRAAN